MPKFIVCAKTDRSDLESRIVSLYPGRSYVLRSNSQWVISTDATAQSLAIQLGVHEGQYGSVVVFAIGSYWGFHDKPLWELLALD